MISTINGLRAKRDAMKDLLRKAGYEVADNACFSDIIKTLEGFVDDYLDLKKTKKEKKK